MEHLRSGPPAPRVGYLRTNRSVLNLETYVERLEAGRGKFREMCIVLIEAKSDRQRVVFAESDDAKRIRAASQLVDQGIADPVLVGDRESIDRTVERLGLDFAPEVVDPDEGNLERYADQLWEFHQRKGVTRREAGGVVRDGNYLASVRSRWATLTRC